MKTIKLTIPIDYLIFLSTRGHDGDDRMPQLLKSWAMRILNENGFNKELEKAQNESIQRLKSKLTNVIGKEGMDLVSKNLNTAKEAIKFIRGTDNLN